jgi:dihydrofolate reductase
MKQLIVAHGIDRSIGEKGRLPWQGLMPRDMHRFRQETLGHAVIMGRLTFESIGRPLPGRENVVLSTHETKIPGCRVVTSLEEAFNISSSHEHAFVIGGASVYYHALEVVERLVITKIDGSFPTADTHFPEIDPAIWVQISTQYYPADDRNSFGCFFEEYERRTDETNIT